MNPVIVAGVGMVPFVKPSVAEPYDQMAVKAANMALKEAGITYKDVQSGYCAYVYGDSTAGQLSLYQLGMTGIPIININNNCSTGSTALFMARQAIQHGIYDCILVLGFEQMKSGAIAEQFTDRPSPFRAFDALCKELVDVDLPLALRYFGGAGKEHMDKYGTSLATFAKIRAKASRHAANNPLAMLRTEVSEEQVLNEPVLWPGVMTRMMACPPTCGAAAAVLCSEKFAKKHRINSKVKIVAQSMVTDFSSTFEERSMIKLVGFDMSKTAAENVYAESRVNPNDIPVCELHDCFAHNELLTYEALGLCPIGGAEKFVCDGDNTYGGKIVTNPSGGLLSKGHPLGATGLAQCYELTHQLRGTAEKRQVPKIRHALQHNLGLGGACVVTLYANH